MLYYDELRGKKKVELDFKIFVENDLKDDLYIMAAEIYKMRQVMHK